jgi:carnitine 3-dehydrogenase
VKDAQFVQESGPEHLAMKQSLFRLLSETLASNVVVASSTSGLLMSELQRDLPGADRFIVGHPFNPPHLMPLVEVVSGKATSPQVVDWALEFYRTVGRHPIRINREVPGHIANRLQAALWREAVHLVKEGVASAADVDAAVVYGPGLRWAIMGPHMVFHLGGGHHGIRWFLEHLGPSFEAWWHDLGAPTLDTQTRQKLIEGVAEEAGETTLADLVDHRDKSLVALLQVLQKG